MCWNERDEMFSFIPQVVGWRDGVVGGVLKLRMVELVMPRPTPPCVVDCMHFWLLEIVLVA